MEIALKRLEGVDKVTISIERQQFVVLYKPNASFQPALLREAVAQSSVTVLKFHVQARGKVEKQETGLVLVAGKDRYALTADSAKLALGQEVIASGDIVNDKKLPYQLKVLDFKATGK
ncbi:MAG: hypothetical protein EXQ56_06845 [Acidobacteria bacterium]|nr:hypothetical protein [Acidobacteriota bacterium]